MPIDRPFAGGVVALHDDDLARIGLAVVYEAAAKATAASALRGLCSLNHEEWIKLERVQFGQILKKIGSRVAELNDPELSERFRDLEAAIASGHEARHLIVHVTWGEGGSGFLGYDYGRSRDVTSHDIDVAVEGCAEIKRAASWFAMRVANLIEEGLLPERADGAGMSIRTERRSVRL